VVPYAAVLHSIATKRTSAVTEVSFTLPCRRLHDMFWEIVGLCVFNIGKFRGSCLKTWHNRSKSLGAFRMEGGVLSEIGGGPFSL
jgi:hypothetical protein